MLAWMGGVGRRGGRERKLMKHHSFNLLSIQLISSDCINSPFALIDTTYIDLLFDANIAVMLICVTSMAAGKGGGGGGLKHPLASCPLQYFLTQSINIVRI